MPSASQPVTDVNIASPAHDAAVPGSGAVIFLLFIPCLAVFNFHDLVASSSSPSVTTRLSRCQAWFLAPFHGSAASSNGFFAGTRLRDACQVENQLKFRADPVQHRSLVVPGSAIGMSLAPPCAAAATTALAVTLLNHRHEEVHRRAPRFWNHRRSTPFGGQLGPRARRSCQPRGLRHALGRGPRPSAP